MDVLGCVSSTIGLCCLLQEVIKRNYKLFRKPKTSIELLNILMQLLDARKKDAELEVKRLCFLKGAQATNESNLWFEQVDKVEREVSSLKDENGRYRPTRGCCFICLRIKLGKLIEKKIGDIRELLESVPHGEDSVAIVVNKRGHILPAIPLMENETHKQIFMKIWGFLLHNNARRIGVWGMGGAGKTTIMSEIYNCLVQGNSQFNQIMYVEATKGSKKVQQDIAKELGLTFQKTDDERARASKLLEAFNTRNAFVLILDDVWEPFSIEEVGIHVPTLENGCKLVIVTRNLMVCRGMETNEDVEVTCLLADGAWILFKEQVGEHVLLDPKVKSIAKDVAKECHGLPLAIVVVERALRNITNVREWENALEELRTSCIGLHNFDEVVISRLKLSYSKLRDDTRRSCFLFCSLYPKGHLIDENELINYWAWEELLGGVSMPAMKRKGQMIIDELILASLLEFQIENRVRCVKLHDLIRDMAVTIMSTEPRCIVNAGVGHAEPPLLDEWNEAVKWVSLIRNDVKAINFSPICPRLTSLLLQYNSFEIIVDDFFDNMPGLKVLDLSYTGISALPVSSSNLKNLSALMLSHCWNLVKIPSLARLTQLGYLDFSFSRRLTKLPEGMEQLTNLRHLDFSFTSVQNLKDGVLSKFTLLEELLILGSPMTVVSSKNTKHYPYYLYPVRVEDIISCHKLSLVHLKLRDIVAYKKILKFLMFSQLKEFKFAVGFQFGETPKLFERTSLAIDMLDMIEEKFSEAEITELIPRNVMQLVIHNPRSIIRRLSLHLLDAMCLKICTIRNCSSECIMISEENNLSQLERLILSNLPILRVICQGVVKPHTLMNLKSIRVKLCLSLRCLFTMQLMLELKSLEEITIVNCRLMEEIIEGERNTNSEEIMEETTVDCHEAKVVLPKLQRLKLSHLPNLKSLYNGDIQCHSLQNLEVYDCNALNKLPLGLFGIEASHQMPPTTLEQIGCDEQWWESLQWDQPEAKCLLQPYLDHHNGSMKTCWDTFAPSSSNTA